eukprot:TRINITY_DN48260_c0_g1_i1.p1 TRINITY_DN48260_c0_g1~~TRINITY_DN48260_c0_g1_i1.p1  ORF type:complete len:648 (-),score=52.44 TRINITY_DN48260_c0_g1_i1:27-1754(-)
MSFHSGLARIQSEVVRCQASSAVAASPPIEHVCSPVSLHGDKRETEKARINASPASTPRPLLSQAHVGGAAIVTDPSKTYADPYCGAWASRGCSIFIRRQGAKYQIDHQGVSIQDVVPVNEFPKFNGLKGQLIGTKIIWENGSEWTRIMAHSSGIQDTSSAPPTQEQAVASTVGNRSDSLASASSTNGRRIVRVKRRSDPVPAMLESKSPSCGSDSLRTNAEQTLDTSSAPQLPASQKTAGARSATDSVPNISRPIKGSANLGSGTVSSALHEDVVMTHCRVAPQAQKEASARRAQETRYIDKLLHDQGWALKIVDASTKSVFQTMLAAANPRALGKGRDVQHHGRSYTKLEVVFAWHLIAPERRDIFDAQRKILHRDRARAEKHGLSIPAVQSRLNSMAGKLPGHLLANEGWYLHGTKPETVLQILSSGLSERMCKGKFGKGVYLAENPEKADQYAAPDSKYDACSELHRRLFRAGSSTRHPDEDLFYMFVVRAAAGIPVRTKDGKSDVDNSSRQIFASAEQRELSEVAGMTPPLRYHSLVVEVGGAVSRFREFVHFNSSRLSVEYLLAYKRVS